MAYMLLVLENKLDRFGKTIDETTGKLAIIERYSPEKFEEIVRDIRDSVDKVERRTELVSFSEEVANHLRTKVATKRDLDLLGNRLSKLEGRFNPESDVEDKFPINVQ